jgi:hypothetical protein
MSDVVVIMRGLALRSTPAASKKKTDPVILEQKTGEKS